MAGGGTSANKLLKSYSTSLSFHFINFGSNLKNYSCHSKILMTIQKN